MASVVSANPFGLLEAEDVAPQEDVLVGQVPKTGPAQPLNKKGKKMPTDIRKEQKKPHHAKGKKHNEGGDRQSGTGHGLNKTVKRGGGGAYNVGGESEVQAEAEEALARERGQKRRRRAADVEEEEESAEPKEPEVEGISLEAFKKQQREQAVQMDKGLKIRDASTAKDEGNFKKTTAFEYKSDFTSEDVLFVLKDDIEHKKSRTGRTQRAKAKTVVKIEPVSFHPQEPRGGSRGGRGGRGGRGRGGGRDAGAPRPYRERRERPHYAEDQQPQAGQAPSSEETPASPVSPSGQEPVIEDSGVVGTDDGFKTAPQRSSRRGRGAERGGSFRGSSRGRGRGGGERGGARGGFRGGRGGQRGGDRPGRGGYRGGPREGGRGGSRGGANKPFASTETDFPPLA